MSAGERAWTGFTPEQMTEKLRDRARVQRGGGTFTSSEPTHMLLDEAADLIDWLAGERGRCIAVVEELGHTHYGTANANLIIRAINDLT